MLIFIGKEILKETNSQIRTKIVIQLWGHGFIKIFEEHSIFMQDVRRSPKERNRGREARGTNLNSHFRTCF